MCKGKEWLVYDVPRGDPLWNKQVRCPTCGEGRQQEYLRMLCGLTPEMQEWTFASTRRFEHIGAAYDTAQLLASAPQRFLTLLGGYGAGKTRLLSCIINAARSAGWTAVYATTADVLDHLRSAYGPRTEISYDARLDLLTSARVLCLDEFDRFSPTPWAQEKFFQLIDARYRDGARLLTCFAANASLDDLPGYVRSRMQDQNCFVYALSGKDVRRLVR